MSKKHILKYAQFRPILSHFPMSTGQIFKPISPHENIIKFFQLKYISILHIKRHQKITQAKVFENFTSQQHALLFSVHHCPNVHQIFTGSRPRLSHIDDSPQEKQAATDCIFNHWLLAFACNLQDDWMTLQWRTGLYLSLRSSSHMELLRS